MKPFISFGNAQFNRNGIKAPEMKTCDSTDSFALLKNKRVLLVEDNDMNRLVAKNSLNYFDMVVTEAVNGEEALAQLKSGHFDVVLMDLQMPLMDGIETAGIIRGEMDLKVPIIALTANAFKSEIDRCLAAGMNDYITKPFDESTLLGTILRNLASSGAALPGPVSKTPVKPASEENRLYNLDYIIQFSKGNDNFVRKMITLFCEQMPDAVGEIRAALAEKDLETVRQVAHRIKPNIVNFGIGDLKQDIRSIEFLARQGVATPELDALTGKLEYIVKRIVDMLRNEYLN
jgi:CheY-like chemotaxis protein